MESIAAEVGETDPNLQSILAAIRRMRKIHADKSRVLSMYESQHLQPQRQQVSAPHWQNLGVSPQSIRKHIPVSPQQPVIPVLSPPSAVPLLAPSNYTERESSDTAKSSHTRSASNFSNFPSMQNSGIMSAQDVKNMAKKVLAERKARKGVITDEMKATKAAAEARRKKAEDKKKSIEQPLQEDSRYWQGKSTLDEVDTASLKARTQGRRRFSIMYEDVTKAAAEVVQSRKAKAKKDAAEERNSTLLRLESSKIQARVELSHKSVRGQLLQATTRRGTYSESF